MPTVAKQLGCLACVVLLAAGPSNAGYESARERGAKAGFKDGSSAGGAEGYREGYVAGFDEAYASTANELLAAGDYWRNPLFTLLVIPAALLAGFAIQFIIFYLIRLTGLFQDIDRILLGREATELNLRTFRRDMEGEIPGENRAAEAVRKAAGQVALILCGLSLFAFAGCRNADERIWKQAYDSQYESAFLSSRHAAKKRGRAEGEKDGVAAAQRDMQNGHGWPMYATLANWTAFFGFLGGAGGQYLVLLICRRRRRISQFLAVAFVPGMKRSFTYSVFQRRRTYLTEIRIELKELQARQKIEAQKLEQVKAGLAQRLDTISSIEELKQARLLELAEEEIAGILVASTKTAREIREADDDAALDFLNTCYCPYCNRPVSYDAHAAHEAVECPHEDCGEHFRLPLALLNNEV